jgi:hypothetical protein
MTYAELKCGKSQETPNTRFDLGFPNLLKSISQGLKVEMASIRLNRRSSDRWRKLAIWAMLPLATFNTRTVVGCGCTGHFEAVCHCNCSAGCGKCDGANGCPCCRNQAALERPASSPASTDASTAFHGRHCKGAVHIEVVPATVISAHAADHFSVPIAALNAPILVAEISGANLHAVAWEHASPPPHDIVVRLHRLVI